MELKEMQTAFQSALKTYEDVEIASKGREKTDEEFKAQKNAVSIMEPLKEKIDLASKADDLKKWKEQPDGSTLTGKYTRDAAPGEGNLDPKHITVDQKTGELAAKSFFGEKALQSFKSDEYYEAMNDYLRHGHHLSQKSAGILQGVINASQQGGVKSGAMKVLNEGSFTSGEAWLPPDFRNQLIERLAAPNTVRQNASVFTTGTDIVTFPVANYTGDSTDDANADIYPVGTRGTWEASGALTSDQSEATNPLAANLRIPVHLYTLPIIFTRSQTEDNSFDLFGWLTKKINEVALLDQEKAYTIGDGAGQPAGFMNHPSLATAVGSTVSAGGFTYTGGMITTGDSDLLKWPIPSDSLDPTTQGILGMNANLPIQYEMGSKWFANKKTYAAVDALTDTTGRPLWYEQGSGLFPSFNNGFNATLKGYPVVKNVFMDSVAKGKYPMVLGNMNAYFIVDRIGITVEVFRETYAARDQVLIYLRMRTGGQLVDYYKLRALKVSA
jgi:HK97 family phage major capsid protein